MVYACVRHTRLAAKTWCETRSLKAGIILRRARHVPRSVELEIAAGTVSKYCFLIMRAGRRSGLVGLQALQHNNAE